jgi:hypothetical protein
MHLPLSMPSNLTDPDPIYRYSTRQEGLYCCHVLYPLFPFVGTGKIADLLPGAKLPICLPAVLHLLTLCVSLLQSVICACSHVHLICSPPLCVSYPSRYLGDQPQVIYTHGLVEVFTCRPEGAAVQTATKPSNPPRTSA